MCGWVDGWVILFDMLTFDFLLKPPQPVTGLFFDTYSTFLRWCYSRTFCIPSHLRFVLKNAESCLPKTYLHTHDERLQYLYIFILHYCKIISCQDYPFLVQCKLFI